MAIDKTFMEDRESLHALVNLLPDRQREEYEGYRSLALEAAFPGRKLIVYDLVQGRPENVQVVTLGDMTMSARGGPVVQATVSPGGHQVGIGMVPLKVPGREVFLHIPQKFEFKWKGKRSPRRGSGDVNFAPHYAILVKTRMQARLAEDGCTYCVRLNSFREMFPEVEPTH